MNKKNVDRFLKNPFVGFFVFLLAVGSFAIRYIGVVLPNFVYIAANIVIILVGIYFMILILRIIFSLYIENLSEAITNKLNPTQFLSREELVYSFESERYGMGYDNLVIQCRINNDGSADIIREVEIKAWSEVSNIDTFLCTYVEGSQDSYNGARSDGIQSYDFHRFDLEITDSKPGMIQKNIRISPPLKPGETTKYRANDYKLLPHFFAIGISKQSFMSQSDKTDFYGWHINRPTRKFYLQVFFPQGIIPIQYEANVKYASSAGTPSDRIQYKEQEQIQTPSLNQIGGQSYLNLEISYPLSGLIYILKWNKIFIEE